MLSERMSGFMKIHWMLALTALALVAFTGGVFYSYVTDPGITADDRSGSQGSANEDESDTDTLPPDVLEAFKGVPPSQITTHITATGEVFHSAPASPDDIQTVIPIIRNALNALPSPEPAPESDLSFRERAINDGAIITYSSGPETAGSKIFLWDGRTVQLPDDAFIDAELEIIHCYPGDEVCPIPPLYVIVRGDAEITVDGDGIVRFLADEARGSSAPQDFDFLKHLITDPDELWKTNTGGPETATSTPELPEEDTSNNASTH